MGICAFVATGLKFDVDGYLRNSPLKPFMVYHPGEALKLGEVSWRPQKEAGFMTLVGQDPEPSLLEQAMKALAFLSQNKAELERLKEAGAEKLHLDFAITKAQISDRAQYLPPQLLLAMGQSGVGLVFSVIDTPPS